MAVSLHPDPFDPLALLAACTEPLPPGGHGAQAIFIGTLRDFNEGDTVRAMTLEHYPGMTEGELERIEREARDRWPLQEVRIAHRVGSITPGEPIVLVAAWSTHRAAAFDACRFLVEALKSRAPFWKQETLADGRQRWVQGNA
ncbi:molybdenum cofactor biosynthesis protein MoaE [Ectothiorhodospira mobilis]|uniref:molybdenum cofactor biosynthesis protein MoaE n=1 Tax=Ectothiorhodospira mobilis TaxID=195064 RepID=UPI001905F962|nr:molybdenum cofactor biosynthesis protein MoaE [Ectothiorhodospira mobilis]MBK1692223.1 molybdopterin converting factor [Ectothiorhodospira mobilis]